MTDERVGSADVRGEAEIALAQPLQRVGSGDDHLRRSLGVVPVNVQRLEQHAGHRGDVTHGRVERGFVHFRRCAKSADLAHELQRRVMQTRVGRLDAGRRSALDDASLQIRAQDSADFAHASKVNEAAFDTAVRDVAAVARVLFQSLHVHGTTPRLRRR